MTKRLLIIMLCCCLPYLPAQAETVRITAGFSLPVVRTPGSLKLGDVVYLRMQDAELSMYLRQLTLQLPAGAEQVTQQMISKLLHEELDETAQIDWIGPRQVPIAGKGTRIASEEMLAVAEKTLREALAEYADDIELQVIGKVNELSASQQGAVLQAKTIQADQPRARMAVRLELLHQGRSIRGSQVWFAVSAKRAVLVANRNLQQADIVSTDAFELSETDIAVLGRRGLQHIEAGLPLRMKRRMAAGDPLLPELIERAPLVTRGDNLKVRLAAAGVHLATRGKAHSDGDAGDIILVTIEDAEAPTRGRITEGGDIEIIY